MTDNWSTLEVLAQLEAKIDSLADSNGSEVDLCCVIFLDAPISETVMRGREVKCRVSIPMVSRTLFLPYLILFSFSMEWREWSSSGTVT